jgi:hypothetical protein
MIFSSMLGELMTISSTAQEEILRAIRSKGYAESVQTEELLEDSKVTAYLRLFWYLRSIVTWNVGPYLDESGAMEEVWARTIEWLVEPQNIKVLSTVNISMYLEVFFELFLNVDFASSEQVCMKLRGQTERIKKYMEDSTYFYDIDCSVQDNFFVFKAVLGALYQFCDKKFSQDISFLALKLVTLSVFKRFYEEKKLLMKVIRHLVEEPFVGERLWFHFEPICREDYEEQIIRVLNNLRNTETFTFLQAELDNISLEVGFARIHCYFQEISHGPVVSLKKYLASVTYGNSSYLFNWIKKRLAEMRDVQLRSDFSKEIIGNLDGLIRKSKAKAREVIVMIPDIGVETIEMLK